MPIYLKQFTGATVALPEGGFLGAGDITPDSPIYYLIIAAYGIRGWGPRRHGGERVPSFSDYRKAVNFSYNGRTLPDVPNGIHKLSDFGVVNGSTIIETLQSWTNSPGFDDATLTITDTISLEPAQRAFMLNPGCAHTFDAAMLKRHIETQQASGIVPNCPLCRQPITPLCMELLIRVVP